MYVQKQGTLKRDKREKPHRGEERLRERKKAYPFTMNLMRPSLAWMASFSALPPPYNRSELQQGGVRDQHLSS
jgi:hypothetical protein